MIARLCEACGVEDTLRRWHCESCGAGLCVDCKGDDPVRCADCRTPAEPSANVSTAPNVPVGTIERTWTPPPPFERPAPVRPDPEPRRVFRKVAVPVHSRVRITARAIGEHLDTAAGGFAAEDKIRRIQLEELIRQEKQSRRTRAE